MNTTQTLTPQQAQAQADAKKKRDRITLWSCIGGVIAILLLVALWAPKAGPAKTSIETGAKAPPPFTMGIITLTTTYHRDFRLNPDNGENLAFAPIGGAIESLVVARNGSEGSLPVSANPDDPKHIIDGRIKLMAFRVYNPSENGRKLMYCKYVGRNPPQGWQDLAFDAGER